LETGFVDIGESGFVVVLGEVEVRSTVDLDIDEPWPDIFAF
jgi:hypothetical protein